MGTIYIKPSICPDSWWVYIGPGTGRGVKHRVVAPWKGQDKKYDPDDIFDPDEIITWSQPVEGHPSISGFSWIGKEAHFRACFEPTPAPTNP